MFVITKDAMNQLEKQLQLSNAKFIEVAIKKSGCSGYRYYIDLCDTISDDYDIIENSPITIVTQKKNHDFLQDVTLDYVQEGLNRSFKFSNPHAKSECGCGESFML